MKKLFLAYIIASIPLIAQAGNYRCSGNKVQFNLTTSPTKITYQAESPDFVWKKDYTFSKSQSQKTLTIKDIIFAKRNLKSKHRLNQIGGVKKINFSVPAEILGKENLPSFTVMDESDGTIKCVGFTPENE